MSLRKINLCFVCLGFGLVFGVANLLAQTSYRIVPGVRVGSITVRSSESDLKKIYGDKNVQSGEIEIGEGETVEGTIIYPNNPLKRIEIIWKDKEVKKNPESIYLSGDQSVWKTKEGVSLGTSLKELERINGRAFVLAGFGWDYGGTVYSWKKGKLEKEFKTEGQRVIVRLGPENSPKSLAKNSKYFGKVDGDVDFSSKNRNMQKINPKVYEIIVEFP